ncbi:MULTISPECIES: BrnT family toxin [unclassified Paraburkholderia]|uniref:BrnT family toxin n=1 Tax=unclassified Paraburkholderia TaxID=2615204 RepID=UPI002AB6DD45|nr:MULTISPECIES: BrnT family toxin [unclassified Paraburkholderia]
MRIEFDGVKRASALAERGLDFARAAEVFAGRNLTRRDDRNDYGEVRFTTAGWLDARIVIVVWTQRGAARRIISMRKANEREINRLAPHLG